MIIINIPLTLAGDDNSIACLGERCRVAKAIMRESGIVLNSRMHLAGDTFWVVMRLEVKALVVDAIRAMRCACIALRQGSCRFGYEFNTSGGAEAFIIRMDEAHAVTIPASELIFWEPKS